jgi:hypothetical protein
MPGTLWSAPSSPQGASSLVTTTLNTSPTPTDLSPNVCLIPAGALNLGTRIRLRAAGEYTASTTASSVTWSFYLSQVGTAISTTASAVLCSTASTALVVLTAAPFILEYTGVMQSLSLQAVATNAKIVGQGWSLLPLTLTSFTGPIPMPQTAAARTVTQTSTITGLNTESPLYASLVVVVATNTGITNITVDELTCELIG